MSKLRAFLLGIREFRLNVTTHVDPGLAGTYDHGRNLAHRVTRFRWDPAH